MGKVLAALLAVASFVPLTSSLAPGRVGEARRATSQSTVWLCRPGVTPDPCSGDLTSTVVSAGGGRTTEPASSATRSGFDCFFVYPTVSTESGANANLDIQPAETAAAEAEASRFSQVCTVWAPMYRQRTLASIAEGLGADPRANAVAYASLLSAWRSFIEHDDDDRPIVFIGHSQGAAMLILLLRQVVEDDPAVRKRIVSAILLGGNVQVPDGKREGGTFAHLPTCASPDEFGCVIAYSSFPGEPPGDALFGRPGQGVSLQSGQRSKKGEVVCVNPADVGSTKAAPLHTYFHLATPDSLGHLWVAYHGALTGRCMTRGGASWLQISPVPGWSSFPALSEVGGAQWGYHVYDAALALGDLVADVRSEERAFTDRSGVTLR